MHVVIYSGGMDSYTLLHSVLEVVPDRKEDVVALSFRYGQRHSKELGYARDECARLNISRHFVIDIRNVGSMLLGSSLTDPAVATPHGHYAAENMKKTVVPGRNTIMLSIAMGVAESLPLGGALHHTVWYGAHAGDHFIYPDCRPNYVSAMQKVFAEATERKVVLAVPFVNLSKGEILRRGQELRERGHDIDYGHTWTCYEGGEHPCGKCGACVERAEAFAYADEHDPLLIGAGQSV